MALKSRTNRYVVSSHTGKYPKCKSEIRLMGNNSQVISSLQFQDETQGVSFIRLLGSSNLIAFDGGHGNASLVTIRRDRLKLIANKVPVTDKGTFFDVIQDTKNGKQLFIRGYDGRYASIKLKYHYE